MGLERRKQLSIFNLAVAPAGRGAREKNMGGSRGSLESPGPLLEPPGPLLTHLHTVCMAYSECLRTRLNPLAERSQRTCFSQARLRARDAAPLRAGRRCAERSGPPRGGKDP
jgi:hypothetical protein